MSLFRKTYLLLNLIFATELWQRPIFDLSRETIFCNLPSSTNLVLTLFQLRKTIIFAKFRLFSTKIWSFVKLPYIFNEVQNKLKIIRQSLRKYSYTFSNFITTSLHHKWKWTRLLSPKGEYTSCLANCQKSKHLGF